LSFFERLLSNARSDSNEENEDSGDCEKVTKKARRSDPVTWANRCSTDIITKELAQICCEEKCTENHLTIARVRKLRIENANRSSTERRVFARILIRSMVIPGTENVSF
jgi:Tfp pilus assembly protein PilV